MRSKLNIAGLSCLAVGGFTAMLVSPAFAQSTNSTLIDVAVPDSFDRGRNESVLEHARPDYQQEPLRYGSFQIWPTAEAGIGVSDNVYQTNNQKIADGYGYFKPAVLVTSDWAINRVEFAASGNLKRYFDASPRNLSLFSVRGSGRLDVGSSFNLYGEARFNRDFESAQTGAVVPTIGTFSTYTRAYLSLRGEYRAGQSRATLAYDHTGLDFSDVKSVTAGVIDQSTRNRVVDRLTGQLEYAFTPSAAVYGQASVESTDYSKPIAAFGGNRDSKSGRAIVGLSVDLAGLLRGKIGVGYAFRNYSLAVFKDVSALSAEAKLEYFPTELTTVTLSGGRTIEDTSIGSTSAFYDTRAAFRVDHELLRNLVLHGIAEVIWQDYLDNDLAAKNYRLNLGADYYSSRKLRLVTSLTVYHRKDNGTGLSNNFYEVSGEVGLIYQF